jgi:hypothetical protein
MEFRRVIAEVSSKRVIDIHKVGSKSDFNDRRLLVSVKDEISIMQHLI